MNIGVHDSGTDNLLTFDGLEGEGKEAVRADGPTIQIDTRPLALLCFLHTQQNPWRIDGYPSQLQQG